MSRSWIVPKRLVIRRVLFGLLAVVLFVFNGIQAGAQEDRTVQEMEEVRVTARSIEGELSGELARYGNQVEIITEEEIEKSGQNDVMQVLEKLVPGLFISPRHGNRMGEADPSLQGGDDSSLLWMIDGVRVSMRLFSTFRPFVPPQYIKRIEVLKGGQGLFYGTQAIDGVINIITKDGEFTRHGEIGVGGGTIGDGDERNLHGMSVYGDDRQEFTLFGSQNQGDARIFREQDFDTTALRRNRAWDVNSVGLKYRRALWDGTLLSINLLRNEMEIDRPVPENFFQRTNERTQDVFQLKYETRFSPSTAFYVKGYWHDWDTEWTRVDVNDTGDLNLVNNDTPWWFEDYGFNAMGTYEQENGSEWLAGVDLQRVKGADFVTNIAPREETVWAGFAQYRPVIPFSPSTKLALGGRYNLADRGDDSFVWNASARQPLGRRTYFRVSGGKSFRNPNITELFQNSLNSSFCPEAGITAPCDRIGSDIAGEDLEPEESLGVNAGVGGVTPIQNQPVEWEIGAFARTIDNLIQNEDLDGSGDTVVPRNASGESTRRGYEARLGVPVGREWRLDVNGTVVDAENDGSNQQPDLVPEEFAKAMLSYDDRDNRYGARVIGTYTGDVFDTVDPAVGGRRNFGDYVLLDLAARYNLDETGHQTVRVRVENLLDVEEAVRLDEATDPNTGALRRVEHITPERNLQIHYTRRF